VTLVKIKSWSRQPAPRSIRSRLEANARAAKVEVERQVAALLTDLAASALSSDDAKAFLDEMPTPGQLMPGVTILELEEKIEDNE
jgi:hypothetical protein